MHTYLRNAVKFYLIYFYKKNGAGSKQIYLQEIYNRNNIIILVNFNTFGFLNLVLRSKD